MKNIIKYLYKILFELTTQISNATVFSEASHKAELRNILNLWKREQLKKIRDRGYIWNEYLDGEI